MREAMSARAWQQLRERRDAAARRESALNISREVELAHEILREFPEMTRDDALREAYRIMSKNQY